MLDLHAVIISLVSFVIGFLVKDYFPSYFKEKSKNLTTKEDIEDITRKVE